MKHVYKELYASRERMKIGVDIGAVILSVTILVWLLNKDKDFKPNFEGFYFMILTILNLVCEGGGCLLYKYDSNSSYIHVKIMFSLYTHSVVYSWLHDTLPSDIMDAHSFICKTLFKYSNGTYTFDLIEQLHHSLDNKMISSR